MTSQPVNYRGYRFPSEIISYAVWLYYRFGLSFRDVEDLLAERGITVTYEAIRHWCRTFGLDYARRLRHRRGRQGDTWHLDELFVKICASRVNRARRSGSLAKASGRIFSATWRLSWVSVVCQTCPIPPSLMSAETS